MPRRGMNDFNADYHSTPHFSRVRLPLYSVCPIVNEFSPIKMDAIWHPDTTRRWKMAEFRYSWTMGKLLCTLWRWAEEDAVTIISTFDSLPTGREQPNICSWQNLRTYRSNGVQWCIFMTHFVFEFKLGNIYNQTLVEICCRTPDVFLDNEIELTYHPMQDNANFCLLTMANTKNHFNTT